MTFIPIVLGSGLAGYGFLTRTRETQQTLLADSAPVARDTRHALDRLREVQSADQLLDDRTLLRVALGAFGLDADIDNRAFLQKILESDLSDGTSLANRLADKRYLALARTFNFKGEAGPSLAGLKVAADVQRDLADIRTAEDLLGNGPLLRATLAEFGLEKDISNTYFLKQVLNSDLSDPASFANRLSDPRYGELAQAFGLGEKAADREKLYGYADLVAGRASGVHTAADLLDDKELLSATLGIFGLKADAGKTGFLTSVLNSDLRDPDSVANLQDDKRYAALAGAFDFAARARAETDGTGAEFRSTLEKFVATATARDERIAAPSDLFSDFRLMLDTFEFFGLPPRPDNVSFVSRILASDRASPTSLVNVFPDQRYRAFADAFSFDNVAEQRTYPPGFAEAIVDRYLDRQFEIQIGESDPAMRIALALERDLGDVVSGGLSENSRWFGIMASKPMRDVFETVLQIPSSVGALDLDQQLTIFRTRSERMLGTTDVADLMSPERLDQLRWRYLVLSEANSALATSAGSIVQSLLAGAVR